jgi:hypothetical protein
MTLQVGMLESDGVVLAGDTRLSRTPRPGVYAPWQSYNGPKVLISPSGRIAISCAHDMQTGKTFAEAIFAGMTHGDDHSCEQQIREIASSVVRGRGIECLIAFSDPLPSLYVLRYAKGEYGDDIESQRIIGFAAMLRVMSAGLFQQMLCVYLPPQLEVSVHLFPWAKILMVHGLFGSLYLFKLHFEFCESLLELVRHGGYCESFLMLIFAWAAPPRVLIP